MAETQGWQELIARLEKATEPNRELDKAITEHLWPGEPLQWPDMYRAEPSHWAKRHIERYTASIDAALMLVPEQFVVTSFKNGDLDPKYLEVHRHTSWSVGLARVGYQLKDAFDIKSGNFPPGRGPTGAIALCIAALRARGS